jgi:hypothetical protein
MKKFIKQGLFFGLIVFSWLSALQLVVDYSVKGKNPRGHDNFELIKNTNVDCLFFGNSRCLTGIDPHLFDSLTDLQSLNLGANGQSNYLFYTLRLKHYLKYNSPPKFCFVLSEPYSSTEKNKNYFQDYARYCFNWFRSDKDYAELLKYYEVDFFEKNIPSFSVLKYRVLWDLIFNNNAKEWKKYGYDHYETTNFCNEDPNPFPTSLWRKDDKQYIIQMTQFDSLCKSNKIRLVNFQLPLTSSENFKHLFYKNKQLSQNLFIDYIDLQSDSLIKCEYFADRYHPNYVGAQIFTSIFAKQFKTSLLRK